MIFKVLKSVVQLNTFSEKAIAKDINIDSNLVKELIGELIRMEYIKPEQKSSCSCSSCSSCSGCASMKSNIDIKLWEVTDKGKKVLGYC